jgi:hypothetical protein
MKTACFVFLALLLMSLQSFAFNRSKCSTYLNDGLYKKYQYQGIDYPLTKATKKEGIASATFVVSTEGSTAFFDPKHATHVSSSPAQYTSSTGSCSFLGQNEMRHQRERYFVQNKETLLKEIARGQGEFLNTLAAYSLCEDSVVSRFAQKLQARTPEFVSSSHQSYGDIIDRTVRTDEKLAKNCFGFEI